MSKSNSLLGIDLAYVLATIGCIMGAVLFNVGGRMHMLSHEHYYLIMDFFPALFFFLNGFTVTLTMRDRRVSSRKLLSYMGRRGSVLMIIGLLFIKIWPVNLFFASGLFFLVSPFFAQWNNLILRSFLVFIWVISVVFINFDFPTYVIFSGLQLGGADFKHLFSFLLLNGYLSPLPWSFFFVAGLIYGRTDFRPRGWLPPSSLISIIVILASIAIEKYATSIYGAKDRDVLLNAWGFNLKFYLPAFLIYGIALCYLLMNTLIYIFRGYIAGAFSNFINNISASKYSIYFFAMFFGIITKSSTNDIIFRERWAILLFAVGVVLLSIWLSFFWKRKVSKKTPIEWMIKKMSSSATK